MAAGAQGEARARGWGLRNAQARSKKIKVSARWGTGLVFGAGLRDGRSQHDLCFIPSKSRGQYPLIWSTNSGISSYTSTLDVEPSSQHHQILRPGDLCPQRSLPPLAHHLRQVPDPDSKEASDDDIAQLKEAGGGDSKSAAINRKRIVIKPISDERSRVGTYNKRKFGVIKKAMELSILCNCKIGMVLSLPVLGHAPSY